MKVSSYIPGAQLVGWEGTGTAEGTGIAEGTGTAEGSEQLNPSGHIWHVCCPSNEYSPCGHDCWEPSLLHMNPAGQTRLVQLIGVLPMATGILAGLLQLYPTGHGWQEVEAGRTV